MSSCCQTNLCIQGEAVVDASREDYHVSCLHKDADPFVLLVPHIEVSTALQNEAYLIIRMKMFLEEYLDLIELCACVCVCVCVLCVRASTLL